MRGIDISNWQGGLNVSTLSGIEFVIVKATEGLDFVDPYCDGWVQQCIALGMPWGFYHFANENDAIAEADFFVDNTLNYFGHGIPVLDWEEGQSVEWVNRFVARVYERTGVHPWIYGNPWRFNQGGVDQNCGRWIADYPDVAAPRIDYQLGDCPEVDGLVCAWQFASDGQVPGYVGNLDVNVFYGDVNAWNAYAGATPTMAEPTHNVEVLSNNKYTVTIEVK